MIEAGEDDEDEDEGEDEDEEVELRAENLEELTGEIMYGLGWTEERARVAADQFLEEVGEDFRAYQAGLDLVRILSENAPFLKRPEERVKPKRKKGRKASGKR